MNFEDTPLYKLRLIERANKQILVISFNNELRNHNWGLYFGIIQQLLVVRRFKNLDFQDISFDLSDCKWFDPVPLMSLLISSHIFITTFKDSINFKFAHFDSDVPSSTDKALKFLATEGFLEQFYKIGNSIYFGGLLVNSGNKDTLFNKINRLDTKLNYTNCTVIKVHIVNTKALYASRQTIEGWLNERLDEAKVGLLGKESDLAIQDLVYKIRILLDETLHNVFQHAYERGDAWAAIYIRFRHGTRNKSLSIEERLNLQENIKLEYRACPRLDFQFAEENNGFVEVFVVDNGVGVLATYGGDEKRKAFRHAIDDIFRHGRRRNVSEVRNITARGGLNLIYDLLQQDRNYICGYSDSEWIGDVVPFNTKTPYLFYDPRNENAVCASGLCWIVRLSMNSSTYLNVEDWKSWSGDLYNNPAFLGYKDSQYLAEELEHFEIIDNRFLINAFADNVKKNVDQSSDSNVRKVVVLLSRQSITKIKVWEDIDQALINFDSLNDLESRILVIGDISEKEALTYSAALIDAKIYNETNSWKNKISNIILITRRFYVCGLRKAITSENISAKGPIHTFIKDLNFTEQYIQGIYFSSSDLPNPIRSIREYVNFIKSYDSYLFWKHLNEHSLKKYLFIDQPIKWNERGVIIEGYLNFSLTLTQNSFIQLYQFSILRCYGLFHNKAAIFRNTDDLTIKLCEEFNSNLEINHKEKLSTLYLGSVYGSGVHERDTLAHWPKIENDLIANFFIHPGVEEFRPRISLFYWNKKQAAVSNELQLGNNAPYERIGSSHAIALYGWKYFPIPRYGENGKSFYKRSPKETYNDWQSVNNSIISYGNLSYQGFTDLIKIDIKKALEYSFKYKTDLAKFLINEFSFVFIDNVVQDLTSDEREISDFYNKIGIVVYPNHLNTSLALSYIRLHFKSIDIEDRLIPIDFTSSYQDSNAYLISPLTLERIKDALKKQVDKGNVNVLFFDCAIVTGKTRRHIYHILEGLGAGSIKTLSIIDRSRLPYYLPNINEIRAFWRLDVPRLAYGDYNPINASLYEIASMKNLFTEPAKCRYEQWEKAWGNRSLGIMLDNGLEPSRLPPTSQQFKKFGINTQPPHDQIGGPDNCIELTNSFGLSIYCAEIHSMTGRDDIALKIVQDHPLAPSIVIELISSQLLLFPHDFSRELRLRMLKQLFQATLSIIESNNHTALAAIVLLREQGSIVTALFKDMFRVQNIQDTFTNLDLRIAMAYLVNKHNLNPLYEINSYDSVLIKNQDDSLWQIYKRFHFEIHEGKGKMHSRPILDIFSSEPKSYEQKLNDGIVSFSRLKSIFQYEIKEWFLRNNMTLTHHSIINKMDGCYQEALVILENKDILKYTEYSQKIKNIVLPFLLSVHASIFYLIFTKTDASVLRRMNTLIKNIISKISPEKWKNEALSKGISIFENGQPVISVSSYTPDFPIKYNTHFNLWVAFDRRVQEEIENLLYNALYAGEKFKDPENASDSRTAHMWIWIEYSNENITINFTNSITEKYEKVKTDITKGRKDAHRHCVFEKALNGYSNIIPITMDDINLVRVTLTLPIL